MDGEQEFWHACLQWRPQPVRPIFYRLYHDDTGTPLRYSMQDEPGTWVDITCEQYHRASFKLRVKDGVLRPTHVPKISKLVPSDHGTQCDVRDVTMIASSGSGRYWSSSDEKS